MCVCINLFIHVDIEVNVYVACLSNLLYVPPPLVLGLHCLNMEQFEIQPESIVLYSSEEHRSHKSIQIQINKCKQQKFNLLTKCLSIAKGNFMFLQ